MRTYSYGSVDVVLTRAQRMISIVMVTVYLCDVRSYRSAYCDILNTGYSTTIRYCCKLLPSVFVLWPWVANASMKKQKWAMTYDRRNVVDGVAERSGASRRKRLRSVWFRRARGDEARFG